MTQAVLGLRHLSQVGCGRHALYPRDLQIRVADLERQLPVAARLCPEPREVFQALGDDVVPDLRRPWQFLDLRVQIDELLRQLTRLRKAVLRNLALAVRRIEPDGQPSNRQSDRTHRQAVPPRETPHAVPGVAGTRLHGAPFHKGLHVVGERIHRWISLSRLLAKRFAENTIEIGRESGVEAAGRCRRPAADRFHHLRAILASRLMRRPAGQQPIKNRSQRVDIARRSLRIAAQLLGARILGRHRPLHRLRLLGCIQNLCDAEIQQLEPARAVHQNVRRLQIPMDDQVAVRVRDCSETCMNSSITLPFVQPGGVPIDRMPSTSSITR